MYFKRLEMHGFKSFAEPCVIDFHEGVTCIVGPNGSGKSNISDAIRWVLGEQSPKALRGGKMEEVIFNGTQSRRPRGMAEVTLVIDNTAGILDIEYKEVAITRRMYRSGESEYLINNNPCRLRDIRELIMDTGIGVDGYSIIGQGKIADIVSNKPESRREIFEESAGVVAYKTRKAEAQRKLESTRNNLERIDDIVGEIEGRIDGLREDSEKATRYLELRDRYQGLEVNITLRNIENAQTRSDQYQHDIKDLEERIQSIRESRKASDEHSQKLQERNTALDKLSEENHQKMVRLMEQASAVESAGKVNLEKIAAMSREEERLSGESEELSQKYDQSAAEARQLQEELETIRKTAEKAKETLEEKVFAYNVITTEQIHYTETMDDSNEKIINLNGEAASKRSEAKSIENYKHTLLRRKDTLEESLAEIGSGRSSDEAALKEAEEETRSLMKDQEALSSRQHALEEDRRKASGREETLRTTVEDWKIRISQQESRRKTIEELQQNLEGYNYGVKYILRCGMRGIEGVVGEMIRVPDGYETAIETALGGAMQNIICKDDQAAKTAITALKVNRSGRLTFLPMESIRARRAELTQEIRNNKGFRGIASDLVEFDQKYQNVFDYLLGRVLVVDHLNTAIALSKITGQGIRIVTLDGEIINASGAITGGKFKNPSASLLERRNEISRLDQETEGFRVRLQAEEKNLSETTASIQEMTEQLQKLEEESREKELSLAALNEKAAGLAGSIEDADTRIAAAEREITAIDKELDDADKMILQMMDESREAETEIERITREMEALSADQEVQRSALERASEEITEARVEAGRWTEKVSHQEELLSRVVQERDELADQFRQRSEELEQLRKDRDELTGSATQSDEVLTELAKQRKDIENYLDTIAQEKSQILEDLRKVSEDISGTENEINTFLDQKYQLEIRSTRNETQLEHLKEHLWDEFEMSYAQAVDLRQEDFAMGAAVKESREIRKELREIGDVNISSIEEYRQVSQRYRFLTEQRKDVVTALEELESIIAELEKTITRAFRDNFNQVEDHFEKVFHELFGGGHAELRMENEKDPLESGIEIVAQPPGKRLQNINLMSGGEKTMTAIALMFAVLQTKPTPFCILDEVEAALDDDNIEKFSRYLKNFVNTQFALITHQKATMEHADSLYGITMPEHGVSRVLSLRLGDYDPDEFTS